MFTSFSQHFLLQYTTSSKFHEGAMLSQLPPVLPAPLVAFHCYKITTIRSFYFSEKGPVHAKLWTNVKLATKSIADILNDTRFPNNPSVSGFLDNFDSPYSMGSRFGLQMWSYFVAPESGLYTFYSACDDVCQVFLSSTDREADKKMIIFQKGWSRQYKYDQ